jgi:hypothetical protein
VQVEADAAHHLLHVRLAKTGVGARGTGLRAVEGRFGGVGERCHIHTRDRRRAAREHLTRMSHGVVVAERWPDCRSFGVRLRPGQPASVYAPSRCCRRHSRWFWYESSAALLMSGTLVRPPDLIEGKTTEVTICPSWESHRDRPKTSAVDDDAQSLA